jgi:uncharacterized membrane protein YagU involved in acid resistance
MPKPAKNKLPVIAILGLLTGTLDAIAAIIINYPVSPGQIFRYIASGLFGKEAFTDDNMVLWGVSFHYLIAFLFSAALVELYPKFKYLTKNKYIIGVLYGLMIWVIMNFAVLPVTNIPKQPISPHINWAANIKAITALVICLGIPIAIASEGFYAKRAYRRSQREARSLNT